MTGPLKADLNIFLLGKSVDSWVFASRIQPLEIREYVPRNQPPLILVYTENSIEIYDVLSGQWIQSVACRRATPLNQKATLSLYSGDSDNVKRLIFLSNPLIDSDQEMIKKTVIIERAWPI